MVKQVKTSENMINFHKKYLTVCTQKLSKVHPLYNTASHTKRRLYKSPKSNEAQSYINF